MALSRTSKLEAVNRVLQMIGEAPVNSLNGQFGLAKQAEDSLLNVSRRVQAEGWSFNTDYERTLTRDSNNEIPVGTDVSRVVIDIHQFPDYDIIQRNTKLYDRRNHTYEFTEDLKGDVTYMFEWDDLPEHARQYIMTRAGRQLQEAIIGSADLTQINLTAEMEARSHFLEEETTKSQHNMIRGNPNHTGVFRTYQPSRAVAR
tara:strand:+ start:51 stop:656 length:606 start_codon:yes stop_codon:yes gene_type:complete